MNISEFIVTATSVVEALLNNLWQGIVLAALSGCLLQLMRRTNATTRYIVWFVTLLALSLTPFYSGLSSRIEAGFKNSASVSAERTRALSQLNQPNDPLSVNSSFENTGHSSIELSGQSFRDEARERASEAGTATPSKTSRAASPVMLNLSSGRWTELLLLAWLLIVGVKLFQVQRSYLYLRHLKRACVPATPKHRMLLRELLTTCNIRRKVRVCYSSLISMPMVVGFTNPTIMFPKALAEMLSDSEFEQVLLHELAHVRRWDDWTNMGQKIIEAIFFFHPAVLWIGRRLNLEREIACDDWVVTNTKEGCRYATCLTKLVEFTITSRRPSLAPHAASGRGQIARRIELLLEAQRNASPYPSKRKLATTLGLVTLAIVLFQKSLPVIALTAPHASASGQTAQKSTSNVEPEGQAESQRTHETRGVAAAGIRLEDRSENFATTTTAQGLEAATSDRQSVARLINAGYEAAHDALPPGQMVKVQSEMAASFVQARLPEPSAGGQRVETSAVEMVREAASVTPDAEKAKLLIEVAQRHSDEQTLPQGFFEATRTINSSQHKGQVLTAVVWKRTTISNKLLLQSLSVAAEINADSDKAAFLVSAADVCPDNEAMLSAFIRTISTIRSAVEKERALSAILKRENLSREVLTQVLNLVMEDMGSNRSRRNIMEQLIGRLSE